MNKHLTINYLEIPVLDMAKTKVFFTQVFGWDFVDYGDSYSCFVNAGITGGFYLSEQYFDLDKGAPLIVIYSEQLEQTMAEVEQAGGQIVKAIFTFPGGRRFHFKDPNGNELAVWSE
ncbi:VOC family protein [Shewanella psychrotolerans]|uniref:VOC family protein n=1 Tax=Shewanella psychrotolerans TaxID=2864206 RepID=UPI001C65BC6B|nr:VOC family protein [Shewanella psychrotolerans]QYK00185.1 VOC family protein [Shewanella psychrotolerans]